MLSQSGVDLISGALCLYIRRAEKDGAGGGGAMVLVGRMDQLSINSQLQNVFLNSAFFFSVFQGCQLL